MKNVLYRRMCPLPARIVLFAVLLAGSVHAQGIQQKFMAVGSLQSWFTNTGCEAEEILVKNQQQNGMQWPAIYLYQDMAAARGFWIGTTNFTDQNGMSFPFKVVHSGPRVSGQGEFFPVSFQTISQFDPPEATVDGDKTSDKPLENDAVDPTLAADREIRVVVNTSIGITMTRRILAFGQQFHDNYFVYEYTFKNTGNVDGDAEIELPNQTLTGVYFFWQYRNAVCRESRYVIGNSTGWGINTMNDTRGDGLNPATTFFPGNQDNDVRAQYSWHGKLPSFTLYDNIGAPVWNPPQSTFEPFSDRSDTSGRLTAHQFIGLVTLHADRALGDPSDDPNQPATTGYEGSDDPLTSQNDQFNVGKMTREYGWMSKGHVSPRHADLVGPSGDPSTGYNGAQTSGGQSFTNGYGPYTLAPGDSVKIVMAEGASGINRQRAIDVGRVYKADPTPAQALIKNQVFYTGRDSLFQTFRRAIANFQSGYTIPRSPKPPKTFTVESGGDRISLSWDVYESDPNLTGFRIYRSLGKYDNENYELIHEAGPAERSYNDQSVVRGVGYFYYIVAVGQASNSGVGNTPPNEALVSSRYYSQTYDPAFLKRQAGSSLSEIRIVPNPYSNAAYHNATDPNSLRFQDAIDRISFFNIPGQCKIRIYTELGELIYELDHTDGSGDASWNSITSSNQIIVSGVYIVHFTVTQDQRDSQGNILYQAGDTAFRKLVVIR
jgi:hypothetical protein